jgi:hypothetical protein
MSEHEALARFQYGCAARHHKVRYAGFGAPGMMHAQRSPLTNILIRIRLLAPKQDLYFGIGHWFTYGHGDLNCRGQVGEVSCAFH